MYSNGKSKAYKPKRPFKTIEGVGTEAWERLDPGAVWVLTEYYKKFNGFNRNNLSLTYKEVKPKMSTLLFSRFNWQLIGFGFLDVVRLGRLERNCSLYGLSDRWRKLTKDPKKLDTIQELLSKVEKLKRKKGSQEKRMKINRLRHEIMKISRV